MALFKSKPTTITKADVLTNMRTEINAAIARASRGGIDQREIASLLEDQAAHYRQRDAMFRSVL